MAYRNLKQTHMDQLRAYLERFVQHIAHAIPDVGIVRICKPNQNLEKIERVPCVPLNVGGQ